MQELIKVQKDDDGRQTVNARELHEFLEVKSKFADWVKNRIKEYDFVENQDYVLVSKNLETGGYVKEYHITIDMAKELSMVERNEKGKQARQYFIECERIAKVKPVYDALNDPAAMRGILLTYTEKVIALQKIVEEQAPKVAALDRIATADGSMCITSAAKHLQVRPKDLFKYLSENEWIYRRVGNKSHLAYQRKVQQNLMEHKITTVINTDGTERIYEQARITAKGMSKLAEVFNVDMNVKTDVARF